MIMMVTVMKQDILKLYNDVFFTDKQGTFDSLPITLQEMVSDWEDGYRRLGGNPNMSSSRQIASLLFLFWEKEQEREI